MWRLTLCHCDLSLTLCLWQCECGLCCVCDSHSVSHCLCHDSQCVVYLGLFTYDSVGPPIALNKKICLECSSSSFSVQGSVFRRIDALLGEFRVGGGVHDSYTFQCGLVGSFTSPGIDTRYKGPTALSVSSDRHWQSGVNGIAKVPKAKRKVAGWLPNHFARLWYKLDWYLY